MKKNWEYKTELELYITIISLWKLYYHLRMTQSIAYKANFLRKTIYCKYVGIPLTEGENQDCFRDEIST